MVHRVHRIISPPTSSRHCAPRAYQREAHRPATPTPYRAIKGAFRTPPFFLLLPHHLYLFFLALSLVAASSASFSLFTTRISFISLGMQIPDDVAEEFNENKNRNALKGLIYVLNPSSNMAHAEALGIVVDFSDA
ncbi:hypothetical protein ARMGADRAFT_1083954 [Armillaria gallica]|uniref:Uncharacterized protein n=1 Tax=Armillaria gallica TaxID=47427 RepID=A0A2H3DDC0_ARMGA|nr:hypothetical protein ARMGADRAFT_1083954 [Armillaria gallica]